MKKIEILDKVKDILINQDNLTIRFNDDYFIQIEIVKRGDFFELDCSKEKKLNIYNVEYYKIIRKVYKIKDNAIKTAIKFIDNNIIDDDTINDYGV
jgi:hypothetical protein